MLASVMIRADAYSRFEYGFKSEETKRKYVKHLEQFFDFCRIEGSSMKEKAQNFSQFARESGMEQTTDLILNYMSFQINRATKNIISKSTVRNFYKPIKLFCDMNNVIFNSKLITKGMPSGFTNSNDRIPTREEVLKMLNYPDRRIKPNNIYNDIFRNKSWRMGIFEMEKYYSNKTTR
jgi:hypothetical protein